MSFQDDLRVSIAEIRSIPFTCGLRPYSVAVRRTTWLGAERGEGSNAVELVPIVEANGAPPKVRWLNAEQLALAGDEFGAELIEVGPITPGNTLRSALTPTTEGNDTVEWIITGPKYPSGAVFTLKDLRDDRGYQFRVVIQKSAD